MPETNTPQEETLIKMDKIALTVLGIGCVFALCAAWYYAMKIGEPQLITESYAPKPIPVAATRYQTQSRLTVESKVKLGIIVVAVSFVAFVGMMLAAAIGYQQFYKNTTPPKQYRDWLERLFIGSIGLIMGFVSSSEIQRETVYVRIADDPAYDTEIAPGIEMGNRFEDGGSTKPQFAFPPSLKDDGASTKPRFAFPPFFPLKSGEKTGSTTNLPVTKDQIPITD